jgi:hypothetical protein
VLVGSECSTCLLEDACFVAFPLAVILDAVARVERAKYRVKCPTSRLRLQLAAAQQDRQNPIAGRIEAAHASFRSHLARAKDMTPKVQGIETSTKSSGVKVKVEGRPWNAPAGQMNSRREPIVIVVDDSSDIEPDTQDESKTNTDATGVGSETPASPMSRTAVQGLLAMTNTFAMAKTDAITEPPISTENTSSTQEVSRFQCVTQRWAGARQLHTYATGCGNAESNSIFGVKFEVV